MDHSTSEGLLIADMRPKTSFWLEDGREEKQARASKGAKGGVPALAAEVFETGEGEAPVCSSCHIRARAEGPAVAASLLIRAPPRASHWGQLGAVKDLPSPPLLSTHARMGSTCGTALRSRAHVKSEPPDVRRLAAQVKTIARVAAQVGAKRGDSVDLR